MTDHTPLDQAPRTIIARDGTAQAGERLIPAEVPIAITYDRTTFAVMMASPIDLQDFALGFSLSEGIVDRVGEIEELEIVDLPVGIELRMSLIAPRRDALEARRRRIVGPASCGLCGIESIAAATESPPVVSSELIFDPATVFSALRRLAEYQPLNRTTRGVHAAGFWSPSAERFLLVREDVGRHNAVDKLIGGMVRRDSSFARGIIVLSSRVSIELVQKAARAGCPVLAAVSAPTTFAVEAARSANITLIAVARDDSFEMFTHAERLSTRTNVP